MPIQSKKTTTTVTRVYSVLYQSRETEILYLDNKQLAGFKRSLTWKKVIDFKKIAVIVIATRIVIY